MEVGGDMVAVTREILDESGGTTSSQDKLMIVLPRKAPLSRARGNTTRQAVRCASKATAPSAQNSRMLPRENSRLTPQVKTPDARIRKAPHQALNTLRA